MAIVDDRGRIGGRVNLIDAVVAFLILILIPVAFGAYLLFRTPQPVLTVVHPNKVHQGPNLQVEVQGENLRPFMRIAFNHLQGRTYMIASTRSALVDLPDVDAGVYDVVLYDHMQEVARLPKALTILPLVPMPVVDMRVAGTFKGLTSDRLQTVKAGDTFLNRGAVVAQVESVGTPVPSTMTLKAGAQELRLSLAGQTGIPAVLKLKCFVTSNPDGS